MVEVKRELEISIISLNKLMEGGAAIFAAEAINHKVVMLGNRARSPLVR